MVDKRTF